jgi:hypothetical protein
VKRKTFYYISLAIPYIALVFSGAFALALYVSGSGSSLFGSSQVGLLDILLGSVLFFLVAGVVWAPLYTWMVAALLFWGRGKNADEIRSMYLLSPVLLGCAMGLPALLVDIPGSVLLLISGLLHVFNLDFIVPTLLENYYPEQALAIGVGWAFMAAICLVVGYAFVGIVLLIERVMKRRGLFSEEVNIGRQPPLL